MLTAPAHSAWCERVVSSASEFIGVGTYLDLRLTGTAFLRATTLALTAFGLAAALRAGAGRATALRAGVGRAAGFAGATSKRTAVK